MSESAPSGTLRTLLTGEPLMPDRAIELMCQLAEGLAAIHAQGVAHCDLKPESVLVVATPSGERARLTAPGTDATGATLVTGNAALPQYLSPEQARGGAADFRSDLYSFGVVAYELLSGRLPFDGPAPADFARQTQEQAPLALATAAPHLVDNVKLLELVGRCLEKDPARRPASAQELAQKLGRVPQVGEPTILMEALQHLPPALPPRPPPLPLAAKPLVVELAAPAPGPVEERKPLLNSVMLPTPTQLGAAEPSPLMAPPKGLAPEPAPRVKTVQVAVLGAVAALALAGLALALQKSPADKARALLLDGKNTEALEVLKTSLHDKDKSGDPKLLALLAATMHQLDRHRDEVTLFKDQIAPKSPESLDPLVLGGLLEDLGRKEDGPSRELVKRIPKEPLYGVLKPIAEGEASPRQWGALRYLDLEGSASELDLVKLYVAALESEECSVRKVAAKRLGQLGDKFAEAELTKVKAAKRTEKACGQDEAAWALGQLGKKAP